MAHINNLLIHYLLQIILNINSSPPKDQRKSSLIKSLSYSYEMTISCFNTCTDKKFDQTYKASFDDGTFFSLFVLIFLGTSKEQQRQSQDPNNRRHKFLCALEICICSTWRKDKLKLFFARLRNEISLENAYTESNDYDTREAWWSHKRGSFLSFFLSTANVNKNHSMMSKTFLCECSLCWQRDGWHMHGSRDFDNTTKSRFCI